MGGAATSVFREAEPPGSNATSAALPLAVRPLLAAIFPSQWCPEQVWVAVDHLGLTLLLGRKPINGAAGKLGPQVAAAAGVRYDE